MPASNVCWGIEVGAAAIKAVKLENLGDGKCRLVDWAIVQHPKVLSTPGVDPNDVIRVALGQFTNQVDLSKATIAISVPGHSSFARFAKLPPVEPKKVAEIIKFEVVDARRVDYTYKMQNTDLIDTAAKFQIDFATSSDRIYWPFNGEFWRDELGYYRQVITSRCGR